MITVKLTRNKAFNWYSRDDIHAKGYLFAPDGRLYRDAGLCHYFSNISTIDHFRHKLQLANGIFSIIIQKDEALWMAVDRLRYFPLFYREKNNDLYIGDEIDNVYQSEEKREIDELACLTFSGCSYVLGNKTLLKGVFQVQAGEFLLYDGIQFTFSFYHQYFSPVQEISFDEAKIHLKKIVQNIGRRMSELIGDRPVLLSLSGGFDSRIVAYLLKKAGIKDVLCYTFGIKEGNPEWKRSKSVAGKLGFEWIFIDYSGIDEPDFYKEKQFIKFYRYVAQYVSKFGFMQYFASNHLINELKIRPDSIFFTGDGGDFFAGSHLRSYMQKYKSTATIAQDLQYIHCNLTQLHKKERETIRRLIEKEVKNEFPLFAKIENWDLKERQSKYILNANKLWENAGFMTQFPLCDNELMDFFVSLPFEYRLNQKLYKTVLSELFEEYDLNFPQDSKQAERTIVQRFKIQIKRIFPFLRKDQGLFQYDYFDLKRFLQPVLKEVQANCRDKKILSSNGIFSEWYLLQVKNEINDK
ncbi:MAG: hypothetical protein LBT24_01855 [Tannerella sp.]|jgi:asparagine synthase (glutamine-hydrolysing)|nr:hypothetical protein [Tannerella sp.]